MKILLVGFLKIFFLSCVLSDSVPCRMCIYDGAMFKKNYPNFQFSTSDMPKRCEAVIYGYYIFDTADGANMYKEDEATIQSILEAGVPVIVYVGFMNDDHWDDIFCTPAAYDQLMVPLIAKIQALKISGIILSVSDIYAGADYANKIVGLVDRIKKEVSPLMIGLSLLAMNSYTNFPDNSLFDFTITNAAIDFYDIEMYTPYTMTCTPELAESGTLITSQDPSILTYEIIANSVAQSTMDKSKTYAKIHIAPYMGKNAVTYIQYCEGGPPVTCSWCADNTKRLHEMGEFVKKNFHGVGVAWPQFDDTSSACGCQPFPATNTIFDGFDGIALTPCAKMDTK